MALDKNTLLGLLFGAQRLSFKPSALFAAAGSIQLVGQGAACHWVWHFDCAGRVGLPRCFKTSH